ncbi:hypothetical protein EDC01DRAFT_628207 [Geopyxis carbonaria]|nr:hypothetical protein EDC01DRAFT_628207 [Geopyxis carbonaria]
MKPSLPQLPHELLLLIGTHLSWPDLASLQRTSSQLLTLLTPVLWSSIVITSHGPFCECAAKCLRHDPFFARSGTSAWEERQRADSFAPDIVGAGRRVLRTGDDHAHTMGCGLLDPPYHTLFRAQLAHVRKAVFMHSFFHDNNSDGTGDGVVRVARWLRLFTGVRTVGLVLGKEWDFDRHLTDLRNHRQLAKGEATSLLLDHRRLRYDLWLQSFLDVFPPSRDVAFELHSRPGNRWDSLHPLYKLLSAGLRLTALSVGPTLWIDELAETRIRALPAALPPTLTTLDWDYVYSHGMIVVPELPHLCQLRINTSNPRNLTPSLRSLAINADLPASFSLAHTPHLTTLILVEDLPVDPLPLPATLLALRLRICSPEMLAILPPGLRVLQIFRADFTSAQLATALSRLTRLHTLHVTRHRSARSLIKYALKYAHDPLLTLVVLLPEVGNDNYESTVVDTLGRIPGWWDEDARGQGLTREWRGWGVRIVLHWSQKRGFAYEHTLVLKCTRLVGEEVVLQQEVGEKTEEWDRLSEWGPSSEMPGWEGVAGGLHALMF